MHMVSPCCPEFVQDHGATDGSGDYASPADRGQIRSQSIPEKGQRNYLDDSLKGFGVRVSQGGTKTFTLMFGKNRRLKTIG